MLMVCAQCILKYDHHCPCEFVVRSLYVASLDSNRQIQGSGNVSARTTTRYAYTFSVSVQSSDAHNYHVTPSSS